MILRNKLIKTFKVDIFFRLVVPETYVGVGYYIYESKKELTYYLTLEQLFVFLEGRQNHTPSIGVSFKIDDVFYSSFKEAYSKFIHLFSNLDFPKDVKNLRLI